MQVLKARNAHQALPEMMHRIQTSEHAMQRGSRNGPVIQFVEPFTIQYERPLERVVFWSERDANPFFHLFESLWMLAGRNDVAYPKQYNSAFGQFSDDGVTFHGAYGYRWRQHFQELREETSEGVTQGWQEPIDQLGRIAKALKENPEDRRQVLQMWDATVDGNGRQGKDFPCNLIAVFQRNHAGALNMTVYNRSNDINWGALGANCVHFSVLQEFLAAWIGCEVGQYWQVSANMHAYLDFGPLKACLPLGDKAFPSQQYVRQDPYAAERVAPFPLVNTDMETWHGDLKMFLEVGANAIGYRDKFFRRVAIPMAQAYEHFKDKANPSRFELAFEALNMMAPCDWRLAATEWMLVRFKKAQEAANKAPAPQPE